MAFALSLLIFDCIYNPHKTYSIGTGKGTSVGKYNSLKRIIHNRTIQQELKLFFLFLNKYFSYEALNLRPSHLFCVCVSDILDLNFLKYLTAFCMLSITIPFINTF